MTKLKIKFLSIILAITITSNIVPIQTFAKGNNKSISQSKRKLQEIQNKIIKNKNDQKELKKLEKKQYDQLQAISQQLIDTEKKIKEKRKEIEKKEAAIKNCNEKISEYARDIESAKQQINETNNKIEEIKKPTLNAIADSYKDFKSGNLRLFNTFNLNNSMSDMIKRQEYISKESDAANSLINDFTTQTNEKQKSKQKLEEMQKDQKKLMEQCKSETNLLRNEERLYNKFNDDNRDCCIALSNKIKTIKNKTEEMKKSEQILDKKFENLKKSEMEQKSNIKDLSASPSDNQPSDHQKKISQKSQFVGESFKAPGLSKKMFIFPVPSGRISSGFGPRRGGFHFALDICANKCTYVFAAASGTVTFAGSSGWGQGHGGYGNCIDIYHGGGFVTRYAHLNNINVKVGEYVKQGDVIGGVGNTGASGGAYHLHWEVIKDGKKVNPKNYY